MKSPRELPSVDALSRHELLAGLDERERTEAARRAIRNARQTGDLADLPEAALQIAQQMAQPGPKSVINATGVVLHTGLGRARPHPDVAEAVRRVSVAHAAVELDLETGERGDRQAALRQQLLGLTGAESALVVNNCAGAVLLALASLAERREVILSRGQMVEIGGAFRLPAIVETSGCRLVEVGTTNRTRISDYVEKIGPYTAAILHCHPSNFYIGGFAGAPGPAELAALCRERGIAFIDDVGSGCLIDTVPYCLPPERTIQQALNEGADLVLASGDKLLGGPQAGLMLGSAEAIERAAKHPLARALRIDRLTVAALAATLGLYERGRHEELPIWRAIARTPEELKLAAERMAWSGRVVEAESEIGGGSMPGVTLPTWAVALPGDPQGTLDRLRRLPTPIIGRTHKGEALLDPRTIEEDEEPIVRETASA